MDGVFANSMIVHDVYKSAAAFVYIINDHITIHAHLEVAFYAVVLSSIRRLVVQISSGSQAVSAVCFHCYCVLQTSAINMLVGLMEPSSGKLFSSAVCVHAQLISTIPPVTIVKQYNFCFSTTVITCRNHCQHSV